MGNRMSRLAHLALLALAGVKDTYSSDGPVLFEVLQDGVLPPPVADQQALLMALGRDYKRINAPLGELGLVTLGVATAALESPSDAQLAQTDVALDALAARRADLADRLRAALDGTAFAGQRVDPAQAAALQQEAQRLLASAHELMPGK